jgi:hypothetical protein
MWGYKNMTQAKKPQELQFANDKHPEPAEFHAVSLNKGL